jgi:hypothetical protein
MSSRKNGSGKKSKNSGNASSARNASNTRKNSSASQNVTFNSLQPMPKIDILINLPLEKIIKMYKISKQTKDFVDENFKNILIAKHKNGATNKFRENRMFKTFADEELFSKEDDEIKEEYSTLNIIEIDLLYNIHTNFIEVYHKINKLKNINSGLMKNFTNDILKLISNGFANIELMIDICTIKYNENKPDIIEFAINLKKKINNNNDERHILIIYKKYHDESVNFINNYTKLLNNDFSLVLDDKDFGLLSKNNIDIVIKIMDENRDKLYETFRRVRRVKYSRRKHYNNDEDSVHRSYDAYYNGNDNHNNNNNSNSNSKIERGRFIAKLKKKLFDSLKKVQNERR